MKTFYVYKTIGRFITTCTIQQKQPSGSQSSRNSQEAKLLSLCPNAKMENVEESNKQMAVLLRKHQATTAKDFNQNPNYQI
jgi:hypothetical protein